MSAQRWPWPACWDATKSWLCQGMRPEWVIVVQGARKLGDSSRVFPKKRISVQWQEKTKPGRTILGSRVQFHKRQKLAFFFFFFFGNFSKMCRQLHFGWVLNGLLAFCCSIKICLSWSRRHKTKSVTLHLWLVFRVFSQITPPLKRSWAEIAARPWHW